MSSSGVVAEQVFGLHDDSTGTTASGLVPGVTCGPLPTSSTRIAL
jgi:hypothetical protein